MIYVFMLIAMLLCPMAGQEKVFSQSSPWNQSSFSHDSWGTGRRVLDYQFDRADRESSPDRWMEEARRGIIAARTVWAEMIPEVFLDAQAEAQFTEWSEQELERRFTRWLLERFFGSALEVPSAAVFRETGEAGKSFIYFTGEDGTILYDPNTGEPRVIRPGDKDYDFAENLLSWREITRAAADREVQDYQVGLMEKYPELLMYISTERKEAFEAKLAAAGEQAVLSLKHEFEATLAREERYFTAQRLGDVWSLRKKSEDRSASAIGTMLIEEARLACADGIASIEARIEAARADGVDLVLAGNQWLEEYREQFRRGLEAWEAAEERFLLRRIEWELSAEQTFYEGMETWNAVFLRFEEERRKWEDEARLLFLEGEGFFAQASQTLEEAIAAAKVEFEKDARLRIGVVSEKIDALTNMYLLSTSAAEEARKSINFCTERYREAKPGITIPAVNEDFGRWIDNELLQLEDTAHRLILEELRSWSALHRNYTEKIQENLGALAKELYSAGGVRDHYETELLRAEAEWAYWKNRVVMAEAVAAYAEAMDAGRMTAAESLEAWEKAKAAYDNAAALYGAADESLREGGAELSAARGVLAEAAEKMRSAAAGLQVLRQDYQLLLSTMGNTGSSMIAEDLAALHLLFSAKQELLGNTGELSLWGNFLATAHELETLYLEETRKEVLQQLIAGDGEGIDSLADLARKAENGDLPEDDPLLRLVELLFDKDSTGEDTINAEQYDFLLSVLLDSFQSRMENELELRLAAISLLIEKNSSTDWYFSVRNAGTPEVPAAMAQDIGARLFGEWERDSFELLRARAELELEALDFLDGREAGEAAAILALLYIGDETKRQQDREALEQILELLNAGAFTDDERTLFFLSGGSFINPDYGHEIVEAFLSDYVRREEFSRNLYDIYTNFSDLAPVIVQENMERALVRLEHLWKTLGIETSGAIFPSSGAIVTALAEMDGDVSPGIPSLIFILDEIFSLLPPWLEFPFTLWEENMIEYGLAPSEETLELAERHAALLDAALFLLSNNAQKTETLAFEAEAARHTAEPLRRFTESIFAPADIPDYDEYENAVEELLGHYSMEKYLRGEIDRLSSLLEMASQDLESKEQEVESMSARIALAEEDYTKLSEAYQEAADTFQRAGADYDALYENLERAFRNQEEARKVFETQDAIRLWAETAYLDERKPAEELAYCREKAGRAFAALELLKSLPADRSISKTGEYESAYASYRESLSLFTLSLDALYKLERTIEAEQEKNKSAYHTYQHYLSQMGQSFSIDEHYVSPEKKSEWSIKDLISVDDNGFLVFSLNNDGRLLGSDEERSEMLKDYFTKNKTAGNEAYMVSSFELALREVSAVLFDKNLTRSEYEQLSYASDYLLREITGKNSDIANIQGWYNTAAIRRNSNLGSMVIRPTFNDKKVYEEAASFDSIINMTQRNSWNTLDADTKRALEFYTILTLLGGGGSDSEYFSRMTEYYEYDNVLQAANERYKHYRKLNNRPVVNIITKNRYRTVKATRNALAVPRNELRANINLAYHGLTETLSALDEKLNAYTESAEKLALLKGQGNEAVHWDDLEKAFALAGELGGDIGDIQIFRELWEHLNEGAENAVYTIPEAMRLLTAAYKNSMDKKSNNLQQVWRRAEGERAAHETVYREAYNAFLAGNADIQEVQASAILSFSETVPSIKAHLENTGNALMENLRMFAELGLSGTPESSLLAGEYAAVISRAWGEKYSAELNVRINEWNLQQRDIQEKLFRWRESAGIIIEQGRIAWQEGEEKLHEAHALWVNTFEEEYERISDGWTAAYLEGLRDKEAWAAAALEAAGESSSAAAMALAGSAAEAGARAMDTRDPLGFMSASDMREGERVLSEFLEKSGTGALSAAFSSIRASAGTLATVVRTGIGGGGIWNSASALAEASTLARTVREEFETRESRKMAFMVMSTSSHLYMSLEENIRLANERFKKQMDETFVIGGQWRRSGAGYIKNVIVHSTFVNSVITERAEVEGYRNFIFAQTIPPAYTDEDSLQNLNAFQIETLIDSIHSEIEELFKLVFDPKTGEFTAHVGEEARVRNNPNVEKGRSGIFENMGSGESGRLMAEFYFWMLKEQLGVAAVAAAPWDKPIWDSRDSAINAPTLRSSVNVVVSAAVLIAGAISTPFSGGLGFVGSVALVAAINSVDDLAFYSLDVAGGYKSHREAGVEFGKVVITNTVSAVSGQAFGGVDGFVRKTLVGGMKTMATGTINSAVASVRYDNENGFGFDKNAFALGVNGSAIGALSSMAGTFTSGWMDLGLEGFTGGVYDNGHALSNFTGGLASQGVNYALGNDFTLNIFNAGKMFSPRASAGLVEMSFGRGGLSFELGGGGADASFGTLVTAAKGFEAWKVNAALLASENSNSRTYASVMRSLYSGTNVNRSEYENILAGRTVIVEREGRALAESEMVNGIKTIYVGSEALNDGRRFSLNAIISHESYRDGIHNGEDGQRMETDNSVMGHILTTIALEKTYGKGVVNESMSREAEQFLNALNNNNSAMIAAILGGYDSSADYWKLMRDGSLLNDNSGWLTYENGAPVLNAEGRQIGANGIETGLLNILFGGTSNMAYSSFSDTQVQLAQSLMTAAGMRYTDGDDGTERSRTWAGNAAGIPLNMDSVMLHAGNVVASQVFARHYDATTDMIIAESIFGRSISDGIAGKSVPQAAMKRYFDLLNVKHAFYTRLGSLVDLSKDYYISGDFGSRYKDYYITYNFRHFGFDLGREGTAEGDALFAGIGGRTSSVDWNYARNGHSIEIEYGYTFENSFVGSGIYGQYLHMKDTPSFSVGTHIDASTQIGQISGTPNFDPHLHYTILTRNGNYSQTMLAMLLGRDASATSFTSTSGDNRVYNPALYYSNFLGQPLPRWAEYEAQRR